MHGPDDDRTVTLLCSPPPPAKAALYLSGETEQAEVLCYPFEVGRLRSAVRRVQREYAGDSHNAAALAALTPAAHANGRPPEPSATPPTRSRSCRLRAPDRRDEEPPEAEPKLPGADAGFWESAPALYDTELALDDPDERPPSEAGPPGRARLVSFLDGPPMFLAEDADCTVVVRPRTPATNPT